jgi:hypothetical protein
VRQAGRRPVGTVRDPRLGHQGFGHRKPAPAATLALAVILPLPAVDHRGAQVAVAGQDSLDDNAVRGPVCAIRGIPVLDRVLDELGDRMHNVTDVVGAGADLQQPFT